MHAAIGKTMGARIIFGKDSVEVSAGITVEKAVSSAGKLPDTYLYLLNGRPIPMTSTLDDGDVVEAVRIASGG